ncbi:hypothetical protein GGX14DRAFT_481563 [Mycena pura]|uniref:Uncharacterized protein n=1 Tax=Mycena pura TaxID=153505 RepID=A0AAD6URR3_9AGAR|nr:hypothetical protein GGX14DRAFT_481563 [Mycena pura]
MPVFRDLVSGPGLDGRDIYHLKLLILQLAAAAVTYGILLLVGLLSSYSLIHRGLGGNRARQLLLMITVTMLLLSTAHLALYVVGVLLQLQALAAEYDNHIITVTLRRLNFTETFLRRLMYFLSDVVVVWRAWAIWTNNRMVHAALAVCLFGTGATSLTLAVFNYNTQFKHIEYETLEQNFLGTFGLLVTNFFATLLISWKFWYYRRNIKVYFSRTDRGNTKTEGVLILLMESGALYCTFWVLLMLGDFGYFGDFGFEWFQPYISGLYPTLIIFMVSRQMMFSEEVVGLKARAPGRSLPNMEFMASGATGSTMKFGRGFDGGATQTSPSSTVVGPGLAIVNTRPIGGMRLHAEL